jgi:hypothetical protein
MENSILVDFISNNLLDVKTSIYYDCTYSKILHDTVRKIHTSLQCYLCSVPTGEEIELFTAVNKIFDADYHEVRSSINLNFAKHLIYDVLIELIVHL